MKALTIGYAHHKHLDINLSWSASTKPACHAIGVSQGMAIFKQQTLRDPPLNSILFNLSAMY